MAVWLTVGDVLAFMADEDAPDPATGDYDRPAVELAVDAAEKYVEQERPDLATETGYAPTPEVKLGAIMLASRLYARRGTTLGVTGFSEFGAAPILRHDPDILRLLRIGAFRPFGFGAPTPTTTEG